MKRLLILAMFGFSFIANAQEKPLSPEQAKQENKATAKEEVKVAAEKSEAEIALAEGKEITVSPKTQVQLTAVSEASNSGIGTTVGLDGQWRMDLNQDKKEVILTGGEIFNKSKVSTHPLRLLIFFDTKAFDVQNPSLGGSMISIVDLDAVNAGEMKQKQSYVMSWVYDGNIPAGSYYPYLVLGQQNPETNNFELVDVKVFTTPVVVP